MVEEEVVEARALATAMWVRAYGEFLVSPNSYSPGFLSWVFGGTFWIAVLEEQPMMSRREVEEARPWKGPLGENHHRGVASGARRGLVSTDDLAATIEAATAIMKMWGSFHGCS